MQRGTSMRTACPEALGVASAGRPAGAPGTARAAARPPRGGGPRARPPPPAPGTAAASDAWPSLVPSRDEGGDEEHREAQHDHPEHDAGAGSADPAYPPPGGPAVLVGPGSPRYRHAAHIIVTPSPLP